MILTRDGNAWQGIEHNVHYRAITRSELTRLLLGAGLKDAQWHTPETSGYYQPILVAYA